MNTVAVNGTGLLPPPLEVLKELGLRGVERYLLDDDVADLRRGEVSVYL